MAESTDEDYLSSQWIAIDIFFPYKTWINNEDRYWWFLKFKMETIRIYLYFTVLGPEITLKKEMIKSLDSLQILSYVWPDAG